MELLLSQVMPIPIPSHALATVKFHSSEPNAALKEALAALASFAQAH